MMKDEDDLDGYFEEVRQEFESFEWQDRWDEPTRPETADLFDCYSYGDFDRDED